MQMKYNTYEQLRAPLNKIIKDVWATELIQFPPPRKRKFPLTDKSNIANSTKIMAMIPMKASH